MDDATVKLINKEFVPLAANGWGFGAVLTARGEVVAPPLRSGDTGGPDGTNNPLGAVRLIHPATQPFRLFLRERAARLPASKRSVGSACEPRTDPTPGSAAPR